MADRSRTSLWATLLFLWSCGTDVAVRGGSATETGNGFQLQVENATGQPFARVPVKLVRTDSWLRDVAATGSPVVITVQSDASGRVHLDSLPAGSWSAQADTNGLSGRIELDGTRKSATLGMRANSELTISVGAGAAESLFVVGTDWRTGVDRAGKANFALPPDLHSVVAYRAGIGLAPAGRYKLSSGIATDSQLVLAPGRLQLDDFGSGTGKTSLWNYTGLGVWYTNSWGTRIYSDSDSTKATVNGRFSMRYSSTDTNSAALAGITFRDGAGFHPMDFSRMDSICFDVRANGKVDLYFVEYAADGAWIRSANAPLGGLDSFWRRQCIARARLGADWELVKSSANVVLFMARRGDLLEVRDLVLWGVRLEDLSRR